MYDARPITIITANNNSFLPVILTDKPVYPETVLPLNRKSPSYERIIEGDEGIRVEVMTNEGGNPITAITRINTDGETLYSDGTLGGITCHHHNQFFVSEQHQFGFFNFNIDVEVNWSGHTVTLSRVGLDEITSETIEVRKTFWSHA